MQWPARTSGGSVPASAPSGCLQDCRRLWRTNVAQRLHSLRRRLSRSLRRRPPRRLRLLLLRRPRALLCHRSSVPDTGSAASASRALRIASCLNDVQAANLQHGSRHAYRYSDLAVDLAFESLTLCGYKGQQFHARTEEGRMPLARSTIYRRLSISCLSPIVAVGYTGQGFDNAVRWMLQVHKGRWPFGTLCNDATAARSGLSASKGQLFGLATLRQIYVPPELAEFADLINKHQLGKQRRRRAAQRPPTPSSRCGRWRSTSWTGAACTSSPALRTATRPT